MPESSSTPNDVIQRGQERYERDIRAQVEPVEKGKMLALDVDTGAYALAEDSVTALNRLKSKHPDARAYILRVGYPTAVKIGIGRKASST